MTWVLVVRTHCHALPLTRPALQCSVLPCPALPFPNLPCPTLPCPTLPCPGCWSRQSNRHNSWTGQEPRNEQVNVQPLSLLAKIKQNWNHRFCIPRLFFFIFIFFHDPSHLASLFYHLSYTDRIFKDANIIIHCYYKFCFSTSHQHCRNWYRLRSNND